MLQDGAILFENNEAGYLSWIAEHPESFVLNTGKNISPSYLVIHQASCRTITNNSNFTTGSYVKICGNSIDSIAEFLIKKRISNSGFRYCGICLKYHPTSDEQELDKMTADLLRRPIVEAPLGVTRPRVRIDRVVRYERDPRVRAWVLANSGGRCECCSQEAPFHDNCGNGFLEVHHVKKMADGGSDKTTNAVALCPNCHRSLHYAGDADSRTERLLKSIQRLIKE